MKTIVLVDDDQAIRESFSLILDKKCFKVNAYSSGLNIFHKEVEVPHLFILDWIMSGINGMDLCRFIRRTEKYAHVPVIILSANADIHTMALKSGATDIICKPYSLRTAREVIKRCVSLNNSRI